MTEEVTETNTAVNDMADVNTEAAAITHEGDCKPNLDAILDINVTLSIEMGSTVMKLKDLLKLTKGSVVTLNKSAGDPLDIMVNGALMAHGEVVVVNDKYGIRLTEIASHNDRLKNL